MGVEQRLDIKGLSWVVPGEAVRVQAENQRVMEVLYGWQREREEGCVLPIGALDLYRLFNCDKRLPLPNEVWSFAKARYQHLYEKDGRMIVGYKHLGTAFKYFESDWGIKLTGYRLNQQAAEVYGEVLKNVFGEPEYVGNGLDLPFDGMVPPFGVIMRRAYGDSHFIVMDGIDRRMLDHYRGIDPYMPFRIQGLFAFAKI